MKQKIFHMTCCLVILLTIAVLVVCSLLSRNGFNLGLAIFGCYLIFPEIGIYVASYFLAFGEKRTDGQLVLCILAIIFCGLILLASAVIFCIDLAKGLLL